MRLRLILVLLLAIVLLCLAAVVVYNLPPVHERLAWRVASWSAQVRRVINPPQKVVFVPQEAGAPGAAEAGTVQAIAQATLNVLMPSATLTPLHSPMPASPQATSTVLPSATPSPSPTPTLTPTPIPASVVLQGIVHEYQQFNNCGPANLAMALSYWGWQGDQRNTRAFLRPNREVDDKNVMPTEMVAFVESESRTGLRALARVGGDLDLLKRLIAAGFPVLIEAGHHPPDDWWMGHYMVVSGYDDALERLTVQDSLISPDLPLPYEEISSRWWRDFNYVYLVIYPPEREAELQAILGLRFDEAYSYQHAAQKALGETAALHGRDLFFAWFNLGSSQVGLGDYAAAASSYDQAFSLYQELPEDQRPYRLMWYQVGPYIAYYNSGRYQDVINLANATFSWAGQPVLEESYYWRGLAYQAQGDLNRAISDFEKAAALNPNYAPPRQALQSMGTPLP
ncbi:MAG: tetratricopeptide repeat protein [Anaerolineales bacterium]|nr:tetratricopeptide repeat protein [Anaerolineales bacterium]